MEKNILRLPYKAHQGKMLLECFFNDYFKGYCLINFELNQTVLNERYFSSLFQTYNKKEVFIKKLNCIGIRAHNHHFKLENLSNYEEGKISIYGILGKDFFKDYSVCKIDKHHNVIFLSIPQ